MTEHLRDQVAKAFGAVEGLYQTLSHLENYLTAQKTQSKLEKR